MIKIGGIRKAGFMVSKTVSVLGYFLYLLGSGIGFKDWFEDADDVEVVSEKYDSPDIDSSSSCTGEDGASRWRPNLVFDSLTAGLGEGDSLQSVPDGGERRSTIPFGARAGTAAHNGGR